MSGIDQSLDDIIKGGSGGRTARGRQTASRARTAAQSRPYSRDGKSAQARLPSRRGGRAEQEEQPSRETLKVGSSTSPNALAGAIAAVVRESPGAIPGVMATGPNSINQAMKGLAIARKHLLEESIDIMVKPQFEEDLRSGSNVVFNIYRASRPINREPTEDDLSAKDKTDCFKLAGAIAGRIRDGEQVACTTKGAVPVLVVIKAIALAQDYVQEEGIDLKFAVQFRDLENTDRGMDKITSTYLHFAILPRS